MLASLNPVKRRHHQAALPNRRNNPDWGPQPVTSLLLYALSLFLRKAVHTNRLNAGLTRFSFSRTIVARSNLSLDVVCATDRFMILDEKPGTAS
jgi:hypothetical protein